MAEKTAQELRAAARERRRSAAPVDEPSVDEAVDAADEGSPDALRAAASGAIAAAAVGAARAFVRRRHGEAGNGDAADAEEREDGAASPEETASAAEVDEDAHADDDRTADIEPRDSAEPGDEPEERESRPRGAVSAGDARRIVERAREQLSELHGADADSVSAVRRTADGWCVGLEVVEVHRIPESTDVLATYEVELDDNGELITFERRGRYYRSEADRR